MKRIIVLGGGYGGILAAKKIEKKLRKDDVKITLIDKNPYHTMLTELHEVAAGRVHEDSIKIYFDQVFAGRKVEVVLDEISNIDFDGQKLTSGKGEYPYDYLVIGTGCKPTFFGKNEIKEKVLTLWSLEDSVLLHEHIVEQFRKAAKIEDANVRKEMLSFVVVGAGFTGVEMAGELGEYVPELCRLYHVDREEISIKLLDMAPRVLPVFPEKLSTNALKKLNKLGVECFNGKPCGEVTDNSIAYGEEIIKSQTIIWVTGVEGSEIVDNLNIEKKGRGRIACNKYLQAEGRKNVYVVGDNIFYIPEGEDKPVPQMVENAEHSSHLVAHNIIADIKGTEKEEYKPKFHGAMVSIGGRKGLAQIGSLNIKNSFIALFIKHFINVLYFISVLGFTKVWSYIKHEFFHVRNERSFVGGTFSNQTPLIWSFPLRLWLGFAWFMQGLPKLAHKLTGGWAEYCTTSELPTNKGLLCDWTGALPSDTDAGASSDGVSAADIAKKLLEDQKITKEQFDVLAGVKETPKAAQYSGFEAVINYIVEFFNGLRPTVLTEGVGYSYDINGIFAYFKQYPVIEYIAIALEWVFNLFVTVSTFFMDNVIAYMAPLFEFILALGETGIGVLLIIGLFTTIAAFGSLILAIMVIVGSLLSFNGVFSSELIWYLVASIALVNIGGKRQVLALDYYVMPKVHGFIQRIPLLKKFYLYGERIDFTNPTKVDQK